MPCSNIRVTKLKACLLSVSVSINRLYLRVLSLLLGDSRKSGAQLQWLHTECFLWVVCLVPRQAFTIWQAWMIRDRLVDCFYRKYNQNTPERENSPISVSILNRSERALCFCCRMCLTSDFCFSFSADMSTVRFCRSRNVRMTSPEKEKTFLQNVFKLLTAP